MMVRESSAARVDRAPSSGIHRAVNEPEKPVLASEVLREELAPIEPGRTAARFWLGAIALTLALLGFAFQAGLGSPEARVLAPNIAYSAAGALCALALLPFPYALRAGTALVVGLALFVLGVRGAGPLAGLAIDGAVARDVARFVAMTLLPAALIFRARYRAFRTARRVLLLALLACLPFVGMQVIPVLDAASPLIARASHVLSVLAVTCGLFGFMDERTTGGGSLSAGLVLGTLSLEIASRELTPLAGAESGPLGYPATAVALGATATLAALGCYQLLAAYFAQEARKSGHSVEQPSAMS